LAVSATLSFLRSSPADDLTIGARQTAEAFVPVTELLQGRLARIPIFATLRLRLAAIGEGTATLLAPYDAAYDGIFESFHGGLLMTLADTAACVAVLTLAGADAPIVTTDMNIRSLAPCRSDVTAEAKIIKLGKTLCPVSVDISDARSVSVAVAQVTYMRLGSRSADEDPRKEQTTQKEPWQCWRLF
jgi:uncharacterized protein (TIGR00369 family)